LVQREERRSGDSYLSHSDARLHFGLGERTKVDSIEVRWPSGTVQRFSDVPANTFAKIVEGSGESRTLPPQRTRESRAGEAAISRRGRGNLAQRSQSMQSWFWRH